MTGIAIVTDPTLGLFGTPLAVELTGPVETRVSGKVGNQTGDFQAEIVSMTLSGEVDTPGGEIIKPYDVTSWSLPGHRGVKAVAVDTRSAELESRLAEVRGEFHLGLEAPANYESALFSADHNESFLAAFFSRKLGLPVSRLARPGEVRGVTVPAGSFVVQRGEGMTKLLAAVKVAPQFLGQTEYKCSEHIRWRRQDGFVDQHSCYLPGN